MADDFSEKLSSILSNPQAMGQIMSIAKSLSGEGETTADTGTYPEEAAEDNSRASPPPSDAGTLGGADWGSLLRSVGGLLGGGGSNPLSGLAELDPRILQAGVRLMGEYNSPMDEKIGLLAALRPFVKEERFRRVDRAIQAARLAKAVRAALRMFRESKGGDHV